MSAIANADAEHPLTSRALLAALPGESGKQRRESRDAGRVAVPTLSGEQRERDAAAARDAKDRDAKAGATGVFSTLFRKKVSFLFDEDEGGRVDS